MNTLFPRAFLKRSPRTRSRKASASHSSDAGCPPSRSYTITLPTTRPPPLQIIPELSEDELDVSAAQSPTTVRPTDSVPIEPSTAPESSRVTLSSYTFSIDDALLMFSDEPPSSPALSASSSTSGSEDAPSTPGSSDDDEYDLILPTPRLRPQRISIRPLCITKTRSLLCQDDEDIHDLLSKDEEKVTPSPVSEEQDENHADATEVLEDAEHDFYTHEFQDFISLYSVAPTPSSPARRDSITITVEPLSTIIEVPEPKPRSRSRHSKPLPSLPPATPSLSTFPSIPTFSLVQTTAQKSIVRRKRNMPALPNYPPPPPPVESRPLPRMAVPEDVDILDLTDEVFEAPTESILIEQLYDQDEDASIYSQPSFTSFSRKSTHLAPSALPETPLAGMYSDFCLLRSSVDSDAPRSSIESTSSFASASSNSSHVPISPFSFPSTPNSVSSDDHESTHPLRSRWSESTLASLAVEQSRSTLLSPLKTVFASRIRRAPLVPSATTTTSQSAPSRNPLHHHFRTPSKLPAPKFALPVTPSPPSTPVRQVRRRASRSSTSSTSTSQCGSPSEFDGCDGSPGGLRRKPIPVEMFLRT